VGKRQDPVIIPPATMLEQTPRPPHAAGEAQSPSGVIDASRLNLSWLLKLRWVAISGQAIAIGVADLAMSFDLPLLLLLSILLLEVVSNLAAAHWAARRATVAEGALAALMAFDVLLLTIILHLTGGPFNPFSSLYLVHIALAAVALSANHTWALSGFAFVAFGALFFLPQDADHSVHHADQMRMHLKGMWVALGTAAVFIAYFVTRVRRDLADRELELARVRAAAQHSEKLASLATLAAGAAHELASPLSTIAIAASELLAALEQQPGSSAVQGDVRLIRQEVERCRTILNQMALEAGQSAGEGFTRVTASELLGDATEGLDPTRIKLTLQGADRDALFVPRRAVGQALRAVIKNALDATPNAAETSIAVQSRGDTCQVWINDSGPGMRPEVLQRVGEPFFTTKEPGAGMGLGLFLSRAVLERLGGSLHIESEPGRGTRVRLDIPRGNMSH
jgi:two-component system sensor histidine kinase RegB